MNGKAKYYTYSTKVETINAVGGSCKMRIKYRHTYSQLDNALIRSDIIEATVVGNRIFSDALKDYQEQEDANRS